MFTLTDLLAHPLPKPFRDRLIAARQLMVVYIKTQEARIIKRG